MESHKLSVKFFLADGVTVTPETIVPVFHGWIREHKVPDHLLVDVADYAHVPEGPGTVLVSHEANFHIDHEGGRTGLLYVRKQPAGGSFGERLQTVVRAALHAANALTIDPEFSGKVRFDTSRVQFRVHDRLHAPNDAQTFNAVKPELERYFTALYGAPVTLGYEPDPERLFQVNITGPSAPDVKSLASRA